MRHVALSVSLVLCTFLAGEASAGQLVYETFDLPQFQTYLQDQPTGSGLVGDWVVEQGETHPTMGGGWKQRLVRDPLTYGGSDPVGYSASSGNRAFHPWESRVAARAQMATPVAADGDSVVWMGFLYSHDQRYVGSSGDPMVILEDSNNPAITAGVHIDRLMSPSRHGVVGVTLGGNQSVNNVFVGYEGSSLPAPEDQVPGAPEWMLDDDRTFFILARLNLTSAGAWAFVNVYADGELPGEEPQTWQAWTWSEDFAGGQFDTLLLGGANANCLYDIDEIRLGTSMQDVLIPEPATVGLLGLGALGLLRGKR